MRASGTTLLLLWVMHATQCLGQQMGFGHQVWNTSGVANPAVQTFPNSIPQSEVPPIWGANGVRDPSKFMNIELGVIGLVREAPDAQLLAFDENSMELVNASELQGSMQLGLRAFVDIYNVCHWFGGTDLQFGYFGINSLDAETTVASVEVSPVFFNSIPVTPDPTANIIYSSNIYSGEANMRFLTWRCVRPIVGLRFFKLEDTYDAFNHGSGNIQRVGGFSTTNNSLFGGQFGLAATLLQVHHWEFYASGKLGVMHNSVEGAANAADALGNEVVKNFSDSSFTTLTDVEAGAVFAMTDNLMFKLGYQFLFADEMALGIDQNSSVRLLSPGETVTFNSQQWHGLNFSSQFRF